VSPLLLVLLAIIAIFGAAAVARALRMKIEQLRRR
jgi:hypothetical protein